MSSHKSISEQEGERLLKLARNSIQAGLTGRRLRVDPADYSGALARMGASFVTLHLDGELRGCIGHLEAQQPLVQDVAENAWMAAFRDPRFAPLSEPEFERLEISLSVLGSPEPLEFSSEGELVGMLRPGIDGLILSDSRHRGTFLPSVWETLPDPHAFLRQLKLKAGLPADYWSDDLQVARYTTQSIH